MIGSLAGGTREVTVIGAGAAGLITAYHLDREGWRVTLVEAEDRVGGLVRTERTPYGISESAAHSFLASPEVKRLFEELQVPLEPVRQDSRARFIERGGRRRRFPLRLHECVIAFLRAYFILTRTSEENLTLEEWAGRHLGKAAVRYALNPFVRGIYAASPSELSVKAAFPALMVPRGHSLLSHFLHKRRMRLRRGAMKPPKNQMMAPRGGMGAWISALESHLRSRLGERFQTGRRLASLPEAANVILCVPAPVAAELLRPREPELASALSQVHYTPLVSVTAFIDKKALPREARGVGVLVPECEGRDGLGILFNSSSFPGRVEDENLHASFTLMLGGSSRPEMAMLPDAELREIVKKEFRELLGAEPVHLVIHRWQRAIPRYDRSIIEVWQKARETWCAEPGRMLFSNWTGQVSLRGMMELAERAFREPGHPADPRAATAEP